MTLVMAPLSLKDTIDITPNGADTDRITCDAPLPETNTVTKVLVLQPLPQVVGNGFPALHKTGLHHVDEQLLVPDRVCKGESRP